MTIKVDLVKRYDLSPWRDRTILAANSFGCGDCGRWFQFARELINHICEERTDADAH